MNRLLRQYLPKGGDFRKLTQCQLNRIADELNSRPRKTLELKVPSTELVEASRVTAGP